MVQFYSTVTIYADTGIRLKEFMDKHPGKYATLTKFVDAAVNEKLAIEEADSNGQKEN